AEFISGLRLYFISQSCFTRFQMVFWPGASHSVRMCSIDSVTWHMGQVALFSCSGMFSQKEPILYDWCMFFHRNSLTCLLKSLLLMDFHMLASFGGLPFIFCTAHLIMSSCAVVFMWGLIFFCSSIPSYRVACVMVLSFAPDRLKLGGVDRSRRGWLGRFAPIAASWSAFSFSSSLLCPFT